MSAVRSRTDTMQCSRLLNAWRYGCTVYRKSSEFFRSVKCVKIYLKWNARPWRSYTKLYYFLVSKYFSYLQHVSLLAAVCMVRMLGEIDALHWRRSICLRDEEAAKEDKRNIPIPRCPLFHNSWESTVVHVDQTSRQWLRENSTAALSTRPTLQAGKLAHANRKQRVLSPQPSLNSDFYIATLWSSLHNFIDLCSKLSRITVGLARSAELTHNKTASCQSITVLCTRNV